jgi:transposase
LRSVSRLKKVLHVTEQQRPDVVDRRIGWQFWRAWIDYRRLVFLDEIGADTKMTRRFGRTWRGYRLVEHVPHGNWKTTTFVSALRASGLTAPLDIDGPLNGSVFLAYVQQQLAPTLQPGYIRILDNLPAHKAPGIRAAIEAVDAQLQYLPPYSPELNPLELASSKLKNLLRKAAARTVTELETTIATLLDCFTPAECGKYLQHSGYLLRT